MRTPRSTHASKRGRSARFDGAITVDEAVAGSLTCGERERIIANGENNAALVVRWLVDLVFAQREMTLNQRATIGCMMLMGLWSTSAVAQNTLGELLDAGGKKLSKDEVKSALSGAHVTGKTMAGAAVEYDFKADGTYVGLVVGQQG